MFCLRSSVRVRVFGQDGVSHRVRNQGIGSGSGSGPKYRSSSYLLFHLLIYLCRAPSPTPYLPTCSGCLARCFLMRPSLRAFLRLFPLVPGPSPPSSMGASPASPSLSGPGAAIETLERGGSAGLRFRPPNQSLHQLRLWNEGVQRGFTFI